MGGKHKRGNTRKSIQNIITDLALMTGWQCLPSKGFTDRVVVTFPAFIDHTASGQHYLISKLVGLKCYLKIIYMYDIHHDKLLLLK